MSATQAMLHPIPLLCPFCVVPGRQGAYEVPGDPANTLELYALAELSVFFVHIEPPSINIWQYAKQQNIFSINSAAEHEL